MNIDSENFTEDEKLVAIRDVLKEMVTYNSITKDNILKAFRWFFDWAVEEASADSEEWIPCSERLPEKSGKYLGQTLHENITDIDFSKKHQKWNAHDSYPPKHAMEIVAWMPLPEPYKVGDQE